MAIYLLLLRFRAEEQNTNLRNFKGKSPFKMATYEKLYFVMIVGTGVLDGP